jgi:hypothetical protein
VSAERKYALDANIFIEAKRRYYAFDLCPGFWEALVWHQARGRVGSVDRVKDELEEGSDELTTWVKNVVPASCFASTDEPGVLKCFGQMVSWVQAQAQFHPEAKAEFADGTDGWLIAHAKANGLVVVTHEVLALDARRRVPIPNVCRAFGVGYVDTFEMLKDLGTKFTWAPPT